MKRFIFIVALLALAVPAMAQPQLVHVTGTVYDFFGQPLPDEAVYIYEVRVPGFLVAMPERTEWTDANGAVDFYLPRTVGLDTARVRMYINAPGWNTKPQGEGVWIATPDAATALISSFTPETVINSPPTLAVIVPNAGSLYGDSLRVADSLARLARLEIDTAETTIAEVEGRRDTTGAFERSQIETDVDNNAQDLVNLETRRDTTGAAERSVIESDVANNAQELVDLEARRDTTGAAARNAIEAEQVTQDAAIADAGKWTTYASGGYSVMSPKISDTLRTKITNDGRAEFAELVKAKDYELNATSGQYFFGTESSNSGSVSKYGLGMLHTSDVSIQYGINSNLLFYHNTTPWVNFSKHEKLSIGSTTHNANRLYVAGNVEVAPDSTLHAKNINMNKDNTFTGKIDFGGVNAFQMSTGGMTGTFNNMIFKTGAVGKFIKFADQSNALLNLWPDSVTIYKPTTLLDHLTLFNAPSTDETRLKMGVGYLSAASGITFYGPSHTYSTLRRHMVVESGWGDLGLASGNLRGIAMYVGNGGSLTDNLTRRKLYMDSNGKTRIGDNGVAANALEVAGNVKIDSGLIVKGAVETVRWVTDSLNNTYVDLDSLKVRIYDEGGRIPRATLTEGRALNQQFRIGCKDYYFELATQSANVVTDTNHTQFPSLNLVADTANNVYISSVEITLHGAWYNNPGYLNTKSLYYVQGDGGAVGTPVVIGQGGASYAWKVLTNTRGAAGQLALIFYGHNFGTLRAEMRVWYSYQDAGGTANPVVNAYSDTPISFSDFKRYP